MPSLTLFKNNTARPLFLTRLLTIFVSGCTNTVSYMSMPESARTPGQIEMAHQERIG